MQIDDIKLAIVGLGYVGLPLAVEFGKKRSVIGFDINEARITELKLGHDHTLEVDDAELKEATGLQFTTSLDQLGQANVFIVTVPTPIDRYKQPDLTPLIKASETIGRVLKKGDIVNIDVAVEKDGWYGDTSRMFCVGTPSTLAQRLVHTTYEALCAGIREVKPGATLGDVGHAIAAVAHREKFSVVREYCGHGIGRKFQKPTIFEQHSVFENLELSMKADKRVRKSLFAKLDSAQQGIGRAA